MAKCVWRAQKDAALSRHQFAFDGWTHVVRRALKRADAEHMCQQKGRCFLYRWRRFGRKSELLEPQLHNKAPCQIDSALHTSLPIYRVDKHRAQIDSLYILRHFLGEKRTRHELSI